MNAWRHLFTERLRECQRGAQIVEFAVALPLLVIFVVGIFDFSNAFTLKQRLTDIARQAARAAAADPVTDLRGGITGINPVSVTDVYYIVDSYLLANNLNDCGLSTSQSATVSGLTWTFSAANGCPSPGLQIVVNRGYHFPASGGAVPNGDCVASSGTGTAVISTCVAIKYAYPWKFDRAASLLGRNTVLPPKISVFAVSMNEN
jgi:hypothetical protein